MARRGWKYGREPPRHGVHDGTDRIRARVVMCATSFMGELVAKHGNVLARLTSLAEEAVSLRLVL